MNAVERVIQERLQSHELGPVRIQWADGIVDEGFVVECPRSDPTEPHAALVPNSVFDERVVCPKNHDIFVTNRDGELRITSERPEDFSPPVVLSERTVDFSLWNPKVLLDDGDNG